MSQQDDDDIIAAAREGFLDEAADMLSQLEASLLVMETDPTDAENLNAAFRAAHTIKGTSGLFGCDAVVSFTHHAETLMESLRSGQLAVSEAVIAALLQSRDQIAALLDEVRTGQQDPAVAHRSVELGAVLHALVQGGSVTPETGGVAKPLASASATTASAEAGLTPSADRPHRCWHLSLRFGPDALRNGLDPLSFIRYLNKVGRIVHLRLIDNHVPALDALNPESAYLGFEIALDSAQTAQTIHGVFEFVMEDCDVQILPPDAPHRDRLALLARRTDDGLESSDTLRALWQTQGLWHDDEGATTDPAVASAIVRDATHGSASELAPSVSTAAPPSSTTAPKAERRTAAKDRRSGGGGGEEARFIRVRADKLDTLIDLIGELVIASSGAQIIAQREASPAFTEAALRIRDLVEAARDGTLSLRMVPIGETFARFQRVVRDVSKALGKDVELEITGGDTELDKSMVDSIADPLMHLVRNSLDHGIETGDERQSRGKHPRGRLALNAYHETGQIVIEVSDDGRGLNRDRIFGKAVEKGIISAEAQLSDAEVHQLICMPGFSTAEQITDISGRGVGMDVVKRNIDALRGQMHLVSTEGRGTTTQIRLPLTLAIIDGFLCSVDKVHYVVPLDMVAECIETPQECRHTEGAAGYFDLRGEVVPYLDLRHYLSHPTSTQGRRSMIVVRTATTRMGLLVDRLLGEYQTVIKPLGRLLRNLRGIAGTTILGSGEVALIVDVPVLLNQATTRLSARTSVHAPASATLPAPRAAPA